MLLYACTDISGTVKSKLILAILGESLSTSRQAAVHTEISHTCFNELQCHFLLQTKLSVVYISESQYDSSAFEIEKFQNGDYICHFRFEQKRSSRHCNYQSDSLQP